MCNKDSELATFYPSLTVKLRPCNEAPDAFRAFCVEQRSALVGLLASRSIGTNELARAAVMHAGLVHLAALTRTRFNVVEIGASAGFLLLWNRIRVDYGDGAVHGPRFNALLVTCENRGQPVPVAVDPDLVGENLGLDLESMDLAGWDDCD